MIRLHSPLSVGECVGTLRQDVDSSWAIFGRKPVVGDVSERRILLRKRLSIFVSNSFQPHLRATFLQDAGGTSITCRFMLHPFVIAFMVFWASMVLLIGGAFAVESVGQLLRPNPPDDAWEGVFFPVGMLGFAAALVGAGWLFSSSDKEFLLNFLKRRLQANELPADRS
jgi:hypothetical protein